MINNVDSALGFSLSDGIGPKSFQRLLQKYGSSVVAWKNLDAITAKELQINAPSYTRFDKFRKTFQETEYREKLQKAKVVYIGFENPNYPSFLKELENPPIGLFCKGNVELLDSTQNIGIVGARKITSYGRDVTEKIASELVSMGLCIVSGLAMGVDATAHKTAIEGHGRTIAVLGCGVDCATPAENQDLYEKILDSSGLVVSEYPLGMPPSKGSFPMRNRIIAGLSLGVLVTEAAEDSGSLITADEALKLGRPIFAVPGPITSQMAQGSLRLLKQGASLVLSGSDILEKLQISGQKLQTIDKIKHMNLSPEEMLILEELRSENLPMDVLSKRSKIPIYKLLGVVTGLELKGVVSQANGDVRIA